MMKKVSRHIYFPQNTNLRKLVDGVFESTLPNRYYSEENMNDWIQQEHKICGHKYFSLEFGNYNDESEEFSWFRFNVSWTKKCDHAGFKIDISLLSLYFYFDIYDNRHWCYKCKKYMTQECFDAGHEDY